MRSLLSPPLQHLARVWRFFRGQHRAFEPVVFERSAASSLDVRHSLNLELDHGRLGLAVVLLLSRSDALSVASFMFDLPPEQVSEADLTDACNELCNVLADRELLGLAKNQPLDLGRAQRLSEAEYLEMLARCRLRHSYQSREIERPVYVLVCERPVG